MISGRVIIILSVLWSLAGVACDGDTKAAPTPTDKPAEKVEPKPTEPELPPPPAITVCEGQQEQTIVATKALTACVTAAAEASGVPDASVTLAKHAADMHACTDDGCGEKVAQALTSYATELASKRESAAGKASCEAQSDALREASTKLLGCTEAAMGGSDIDEAITKMIAFSDEMCACKEKICADIVMNSMTKFGEAMAKKYEGRQQPEISEAQQKRMEEPMKRFTECSMKAMGG